MTDCLHVQRNALTHCSVSQRCKCSDLSAAKAWARIQEQLFGELGLWAPAAEAPPCSQWELDWREGPARMRKRLRRSSPRAAQRAEGPQVSPMLQGTEAGCGEAVSVASLSVCPSICPSGVVFIGTSGVLLRALMWAGGGENVCGERQDCSALFLMQFNRKK